MDCFFLNNSPKQAQGVSLYAEMVFSDQTNERRDVVRNCMADSKSHLKRNLLSVTFHKIQTIFSLKSVFNIKSIWGTNSYMKLRRITEIFVAASTLLQKWQRTWYASWKPLSYILLWMKALVFKGNLNSCFFIELLPFKIFYR